MFFSYKKYFQMAFLGLLGISLWLLIKRDPKQCKNILLYANNMVKYMPIDKSAMGMISPIVDFTNTGGGFMNGLNNNSYSLEDVPSFNERKIMQSGGVQSGGVQSGGVQQSGVAGAGGTQWGGGATKATKRSVSETKKKYVASMQNWKCGSCNEQLTAWFEVDHKVRLEHGGGNNVENLIALCRDCHGRKTAMENM